jgi:glucosamine-6-phosphate deaminase
MTLQIHVFPDHEAVSQAVAGRLRTFLHEYPRAVLALPSGNTPRRTYEVLAAHPEAFREARVFALDEYLGLDGTDERSFAAFFARHVFGPLGVAPGRARVLDGRAADPLAEAAAYDAAIAGAGGLDLTLLGLGANGHIAFNEPAEALSARTHVVALAKPASDVAPKGITMGVGTLLQAPRVWLMATGRGKAEAVARMLGGRVDPRCPASLLQVHPAAEVFLDTSAAEGLSGIVDLAPGGV